MKLKPNPLPPVWQSLPLHKLLTRAQIEAVVLILNENPDSIERVKKLKAYLRPLSEQLETKGVVADYLAYAIENLAHKTMPPPKRIEQWETWLLLLALLLTLTWAVRVAA